MINLYSDTQSLPTPAMREAMSRARVGDEQMGLDPTVNQLVEAVAAHLGKAAGLFLPSGTMANAIALASHCQRGEAVITASCSHILRFEAGGLAVITGAVPEVIEAEDGRFTADQVSQHHQPGDRYTPKTTLVAVEQTCNKAGGTVWPVAQLAEVAARARALGLKTHMDGARLFNAVVATGAQAREHCRDYDSVWVDFSKGLGAPFGAVLCGSEEFIARAWAWKHRLGGAMRQAGVMAAGCLHALEHHIDRLAEDHAHARLLNDGLKQLAGLKVRHDQAETNMVFFDLLDPGIPPERFLGRLEQRGLRIGHVGNGYRAVTYMDVTAGQVREALAILGEVLDELGAGPLGPAPGSGNTAGTPREG